MHALIAESGLPRQRACAAVGESRATSYRYPRSSEPKATVRQASHRRLPEVQRAEVLDLLHSPRFCDQTPTHTYHTLLAEGTFICSIRTMQRLLKEAGEAHDRRPIRPPQVHAVPRLQAVAPNQVWTWDITKLPLVDRGLRLFLYVLIDLYSRYVIGWMVAGTESGALACRFVGGCVAAHPTATGLTVHQDRGSPMTSTCFIDLLAELQVGISHSRPRVSNDNAYSEAHFKTLKTQPDYPGRFTDTAHARRWCDDFFRWYNDEHQHSGLNGYTPADVFQGRAAALQATKQAALDAAYARHPERFVHGPPKAKSPPEKVFINPLPNALVTPAVPTGTNEIPNTPATNEVSK